jgi:hypothetical protein
MAKELGERMDESESYSISASGKSSIPKSAISMNMIEEPMAELIVPTVVVRSPIHQQQEINNIRHA